MGLYLLLRTIGTVFYLMELVILADCILSWLVMGGNSGPPAAVTAGNKTVTRGRRGRQATPSTQPKTSPLAWGRCSCPTGPPRPRLGPCSR